MNGKRFLAVVMSLCMLSAEASHCAPFITQRIAAHADSAEIGSNSSGEVKSLTTRIGDVNGDGNITEDDKTLLQKWLVNMVSKNELKLNNADVNSDGTVDIIDLVELSRLCAKNPNYSYGSSDGNTVDLESAELDADSEIFSEINTDDNAFKVSMDITASSEALDTLSVSESEYSSAIQSSDMVIGSIPSFECEEGAEINDMALNFDIDNDSIINTNYKYASLSSDFEGIKRFNVFKYSEDTGMLLPVETTYDESNNRVTAHVDDLGTYCLVDLEKWFDNLGIKPEEFVKNTDTETNGNNTSGTSGSKSTAKAGDPIDPYDFIPKNNYEVFRYAESIGLYNDKNGAAYRFDHNKQKNKKLDIAIDMSVGQGNSPEMIDLVKLEAKSFLYFIYNFHFDESCDIRVIFYNYDKSKWNAYLNDAEAVRRQDSSLRSYVFYKEAHSYEECVKIINQLNVREGYTGKYPETTAQSRGFTPDPGKFIPFYYRHGFFVHPNSFNNYKSIMYNYRNNIAFYNLLYFYDYKFRKYNYNKTKTETDKTMAVSFLPYMYCFCTPNNEEFVYETNMNSSVTFKYDNYKYFGYLLSQSVSMNLVDNNSGGGSDSSSSSGGSSGSGTGSSGSSGSGSGNTSGDNKVYDIITPIGWKKIKLKKTIDQIYQEYYKNFDILDRNPEFREDMKSYCTDSDYDGLFDFEEICFEDENDDSVRITLKDGNVILPTLEECMNGSTYMDGTPFKIKGMTIKEISEKSNCRILPIYSDPNDKDTDDDGINDFDEDRDDRLKVNFITIDDSLLDDSECINGEKPGITDDAKYNINRYGGYYSITEVSDEPSEKCYKNEARYTRTRKYGICDAKFTLTPSRNSYFAFTITNTQETLGEGYSTDDYKSTVEIFYDTGLINKKKNQVQPAEIKLNGDGTEITYVFALEKGKEYSIKVNNPINNHVGTYTIRVSEDNWVYAPNGGKWEVTDYSLGSLIANQLSDEEIYLSDTRMVEVIAELTNGTIVPIDPNGDIEAQLEDVLNNNGMKVTKDDLKSAALSLAGATATVTGTILVILWPVTSSTPAGQAILVRVAKKVATTGSTIFTYWAVPGSLSTFNAYLEQYGFKRAFTEGNCNVYASKNIAQYGKTWDPWLTSPYIHKISIMGDFGKVNKDITNKEIIDWCGWHMEKSA